MLFCFVLLLFLKYNYLPFCTSPIILLVCPPVFCIVFVFPFPWVLQSSQEKLKTMLMQNFGEQTGCIMGDVHMANSSDAWLVQFDIPRRICFFLFFFGGLFSTPELLIDLTYGVFDTTDLKRAILISLQWQNESF